MAITKTITVRKRYDQIIDYVTDSKKTNPLLSNIQYVSNEIKTNKQELITCINCLESDPYRSMINTKKMFHDEKEIVCFHAIQSFQPGELTPDFCHQIGVELANKLWTERYEVIVCTHTDKPHLHNHFVINATSFVDGKRYCNTNADIRRFKEMSDELCQKYHLSIIQDTQVKSSLTQKQYHQDKSLRSMIRKDIDVAIKNSLTMKEFICTLENEGYEIKSDGNSLSLKHMRAKRFVRLKSLGENYELDTIKKRVLNHPIQPSTKQNYFEKHKFDILPFFLRYKRKELVGLQKLYLSYLYAFGVIPKPRPVKLTAKMKEDLRYINQISEQTILLCKNNINTIEELNVYKLDQEDKLKELETQKKTIRNRIRRCSNNETKKQLQEEAKALTPTIKQLRHSIKTCDAIVHRTTLMIQKESPNKDYVR